MLLTVVSRSGAAYFSMIVAAETRKRPYCVVLGFRQWRTGKPGGAVGKFYACAGWVMDSTVDLGSCDVFPRRACRWEEQPSAFPGVFALEGGHIEVWRNPCACLRNTLCLYRRIYTAIKGVFWCWVVEGLGGNGGRVNV